MTALLAGVLIGLCLWWWTHWMQEKKADDEISARLKASSLVLNHLLDETMETLRCIYCQNTIRWPKTEIWPSNCLHCGRGPAYHVCQLKDTK